MTIDNQDVSLGSERLVLFVEQTYTRLKAAPLG